MKKMMASLGWILLILPLISVAGTKAIYKTLNEPDSEKRSVSNFTGINSGGSFEVHVKMGNDESLRIEGDEDIIADVETVVEKGILKIRNTRKNSGWNWNSKNKTVIYIIAKSLNSLSVSGSGKMIVDGPLKSDKINAQVSGSGTIKFSASGGSLNAAISGSGSITASGNIKSANIVVSGSGRFNGKDLKTSNSDVKVSGSGSANVFANDQLNASLSGSGSINYSGNAEVNQSKSGSGRISKN